MKTKTLEQQEGKNGVLSSLNMKICKFCNQQFEPKYKWNKNIFCSRGCRVNSSKNTLREFNKKRIGRTFEDIFGKEKAAIIKKKQSIAVSKNNIRKGIVPPSRKGIKSTMPIEFFRKIGVLSVIAQSKNKGPTSIERILYKYLEKRGICFDQQYLINDHFVVDAYIPSLNLVIEADGNYWHSLEKNIKRDRSKNAYLTKCGFDLIRLTETEINNGCFCEKLNERFR